MLGHHRETALLDAIVLAKCGRPELGDNILRTLLQVYLQLYCDIIGLQSCRNRWKKNAKSGLLRRSMSFKVIEVGINRKPVCNFLLVINSNWNPISYRFGVMAACCSNFEHVAFLSHPLGSLETMYVVRCSSWAQWKARSGLPISVTAEALRAKIERKSAISLHRDQFEAKFQVEGFAPHQPFFFSENEAKWSFVRYKNLDRFIFRFVTIYAFDKTDRRTDRQRGKNSHSRNWKQVSRELNIVNSRTYSRTLIQGPGQRQEF